MRFNSISLRDYKGVRFVKFAPRPSGITIIEGENEAGKTSIAEALWLIFEQNDDSSSQLVRSLKPAGRDAATEIELEISTGPYRFTYFKRFHRSPRTELTVWEPKRERLAGREADARARQILAETIDRDLWNAMRVQQGASLDPLVPGQHQSLLSALEIAAGHILGGEREQSVYEKVCEEYERYYTSQGRERASANGENAPKLRAARDAAMDEATRLAARISGLQDRATHAAELERELTALATRESALLASTVDLATADEARRLQRSAVDALASDLRLHESTLQGALAAHETRQRAIEGIAPRREELQNTAARIELLARPLEQATSAREQAAEALERVLEGDVAASASRVAAEGQLQLANAHFTAQTMAERLERLERHEPELKELAQWINACRIDRSTMAGLEKAHSRAEQARARREAEGASVELAAAAGVDFTINGRPVRIEPGTSRKGTVLGESVIALPGGLTITVRAGRKALEAASESTAAEEALVRLLQQAGVESLEAARVVSDERIEREERRRNLEEQLKNDLRDLESAEVLREKLGRQRALVAGLTPGSDSALPSIESAKAALEAANRAASQADSETRAARSALAEAELAYSGLERERDTLAERLEAIRTEVERLEVDLAARRAEQSDAQIEDALRSCEKARSQTAIALTEASIQLESLPNVAEELAKLLADAQRLRAESSEKTIELAGIRAVLEEAGAEGLHGQLSEAEQRLDATQEELDSFLRRAAAAKLLFETFRRHRDTARANYAQPLRDKINELGRIMYGSGFGVELADDLSIARRTQDGIDLEVALLSVGVREQLAVLTRLACAALVSNSGSAPLVLDDVLGWSDPNRLRKFAPLLAKAAGDGQVLLFTCTPERFAMVTPARVFSLADQSTTDRDERGVSELAAPVPVLPRQRQSLPERGPQATLDLFGASEPEAITAPRRRD